MTDFFYKKSLGQNFLHNPRILSRIAQSANITSDDVVIEIGCGNGSLSEEILNKNPKKMFIIELDERCIELTQNRLQNHQYFKNLHIIHQDALHFDISTLEIKEKPIIVSNLPYSVGSRIFINLIAKIDTIKLMILMFQKEVAKRIVAKEKTKEYGILSVMTSIVAKSKIEFDVSPANFTPSPKVTSSVISCHGINSGITEGQFLEILDKVKTLFANRRKMLRSYCNNLSHEDLEKFGNFRIEDLSPLAIMNIAKNLS
ncbi:16S rRNA (adenine(1518)-N(6)/adenine(1519)-N(6))-dimethyltransferase RsmA [Candidatus Deianiraea vastatrix]|uniref:Ribosomal RNA small subunit methyltransferase A n=1 Tax=Candidatus Deianiraea vastatrix TaxID=2163644 RepID=A0A5B8XF42_9RICK|nr:16S rRNA (adenine(1518)-N(6)/adenine(1519)-N(6))-dimethyltransferase RsmA [Candidatus Deianiraea vastatrix]QED23535.1 Ribosomal RNA small subunit methyltransferase A [Candidatus Deianiraea vastatrix]